MITNRAYKSTVEKWLWTRGSFVVKIKQDSSDSDSYESVV